MRYGNWPDFAFSQEITGLNESAKDNVSSNKFGKNQQSYPRIQIHRNITHRNVTRKNIKINSDTDMYQTNTLRKLGQIGKKVQKRNPPIRRVVII
mmetsp:Transcript_11338/g.33397  ORF Transcript_11338/g.33397 Transcript_11338/m.33397 type:complete len:95 (-) Transcript_11338:1117-1401(-)